MNIKKYFCCIHKQLRSHPVQLLEFMRASLWRIPAPFNVCPFLIKLFLVVKVSSKSGNPAFLLLQGQSITLPAQNSHLHQRIYGSYCTEVALWSTSGLNLSQILCCTRARKRTYAPLPPSVVSPSTGTVTALNGSESALCRHGRRVVRPPGRRWQRRSWRQDPAAEAMDVLADSSLPHRQVCARACVRRWRCL